MRNTETGWSWDKPVLSKRFRAEMALAVNLWKICLAENFRARFLFQLPRFSILLSASVFCRNKKKKKKKKKSTARIFYAKNSYPSSFLVGKMLLRFWNVVASSLEKFQAATRVFLYIISVEKKKILYFGRIKVPCINIPTEFRVSRIYPKKTARNTYAVSYRTSRFSWGFGPPSGAP